MALGVPKAARAGGDPRWVQGVFPSGVGGDGWKRKRCRGIPVASV